MIMDIPKLKNHLKLTGILAVIAFIISSYVFGTFNHSEVAEDDRSLAMIIFILFAIIINLFYYDSYTKGKKFFDNFND